MPNWVFLTILIITGPTEYIVAVAGNTAKGTININYKVIIEVLIEVYFKIIARKNTIFIRN